MRIAQVAPLYESVPPAQYGGTERVVSWLTEELVAAGHDVTLFASGGSRTSARLVPCSPKSLRTDPECRDPLAYHIHEIEEVARAASEFDVIHFHVDYLHFPVSRRDKLCQITTLHGRLDMPDLVPVYRQFPDMPVCSISLAQRKPLPWVNWVGNVYHGLPLRSFSLQREPGKYLAFLARISPEKRPDRAIEIATRAGIPLKIAAKVDAADKKYFDRKIKKLLKNPLVEFIGEIGDKEKQAFLGNAKACLMPIDWPEPFGLNMIESMACGTPTIAFRHGSVPEIVTDAVSGFIVDNVDEAVDAVSRIGTISRAGCRAAFEKRFTSDRMASDYLRLYESQICNEAARSEVNVNTMATIPEGIAS
jgi:glycosyltransferase involved in cell wall biosynthesis